MDGKMLRLSCPGVITGVPWGHPAGASAVQEKSMSDFWDEFILLLRQILQCHPFLIKDVRNGIISET